MDKMKRLWRGAGRVVCLLLPALLLLGTVPLAEETCEQIIATYKWDDYESPCGEYDICVYGHFWGYLIDLNQDKGQLILKTPVAGTSTYFAHDRESGFLDPEYPMTMYVIGNDILELPEGELHLREHNIWMADTWKFAASALVIGGTGRYEGATGHLFMGNDGTGQGSIQGEFCYGGEGDEESIPPAPSARRPR